MVILLIISLGVTVVVWSNAGPVWGLVTGFLLFGGVGWKLLLTIPGLFVRISSRGDSQEFIKAWEERSGEMEFGRRDTYPPGGLYQAWRQAKSETGTTAADWLESQGYMSLPKEGEKKVTTGWHYEIKGFDDQAQWNELGPNFAATRSFQYLSGGPSGMGAGYTHVENCMHTHKSRAGATPCLERYRLENGVPSLDDLKPKPPRLAGLGTYRSGDNPNASQGLVECWDFGIVCRDVSEGDKTHNLLTSWEQVRSCHVRAGPNGRELMIEVDVPGAGPGYRCSIEVVEFGEGGEQSWLNFLEEQGVTVGAGETADGYGEMP